MRFSRLAGVVAVTAGALAAVRCTTNGLDDYSSTYGQSDAAGDEVKPAVDAGEGGAGDASDSGADRCAPKCAVGACGDDGCGGTCGCADAGGCVDGKCYPCGDPWRTSGLTNHMAFDAKRNYVFSAVPVDGGSAIATLNACTGEIIQARTPAPSEAGIDPVPDTQEFVPFGDYVYTRGSKSPGATPVDTTVYRYNVLTNTVDVRGVIPTAPTDEIWTLAVAGSGKLFASATYGAPSGQTRIVPIAPDGTSCGGVAVPGAGVRGGAIGASGDDVYEAYYTNNPKELGIVHFSAAACTTTAPCVCPPVDIYPTVTLPIAFPASSQVTTYFLLARAALVYVAGLQVLTSGGAVGFIAVFDTVSKAWSPAYIYSPNGGTALDGLTSTTITPDGKVLWAVGAQAAFSPNGLGVLLRFNLPFPTTAAPVPTAIVNVPGTSALWDVKVTDSAVYLAGDKGVVAKCRTDLTCKP